MGLHVVLVGRLRPDLGTMDVLDGLPVADVRHLDAVRSTVEEYGGPSGSLIVTCQQQDAREVRRALAMVSVALPRVATVLEPLPGPPLAVAVGSALIGGADEVAVQLAALDRLRAELWSAVWLPKVGKLSHPTPSIVQHARGWFSGGFLAVYDANPRVVTAAAAPLRGLENAPNGAMLAATESAAPAWVRRSLADTVQPLSSMALRSWRNPADSYGEDDAIEFVLVPHTMLDGTAANSHSGAPCRGCGQRHPRNFCPFCGMDATSSYNGIDVRGGVVR